MLLIGDRPKLALGRSPITRRHDKMISRQVNSRTQEMARVCEVGLFGKFHKNGTKELPKWYRIWPFLY